MRDVEAELARVRSDRDLITDALHQAERALAAERAARNASDADATQLRTAARAYLLAGSYVDRFRLRAELEVLVAVERSGMMLMKAVAQLQHAWDELGDCCNEFEPENMTACAEYRDALDTAILAVLKAGGG